MKASRSASLSPLTLPTVALVAGCAALGPAEPAAWQDFVATFAGEPFESRDYPAGTTKVSVSVNAPNSIEGGNGRFARWCSAQGGTSGQVQHLARSNATAGTFHDGLAAKSNAEQASGLSFVAVSAVGCLAKQGQSLLAVMVSALVSLMLRQPWAGFHFSAEGDMLRVSTPAMDQPAVVKGLRRADGALAHCRSRCARASASCASLRPSTDAWICASL